MKKKVSGSLDSNTNINNINSSTNNNISNTSRINTNTNSSTNTNNNTNSSTNRNTNSEGVGQHLTYTALVLKNRFIPLGFLKS